MIAGKRYPQETRKDPIIWLPPVSESPGLSQPRKAFGSLSPGPQFEQYRPIFEKAEDAARQFDEASKQGGDDWLWSRLMTAYDEINRLQPSIAEIHAPIEEFAIEADWKVEITFERGIPTNGST